MIRYCKTTRDNLCPSVWGPVQKGEDPYAAQGGGGGCCSIQVSSPTHGWHGRGRSANNRSVYRSKMAGFSATSLDPRADTRLRIGLPLSLSAPPPPPALSSLSIITVFSSFYVFSIRLVFSLDTPPPSPPAPEHPSRTCSYRGYRRWSQWSSKGRRALSTCHTLSSSLYFTPPCSIRRFCHFPVIVRGVCGGGRETARLDASGVGRARGTTVGTTRIPKGPAQL